MPYKRWVVVIVAVSLIVGAIYISEYRRPYIATDTKVSSDTKPIIIIDAGHGGIDSGTSGSDGTQEKELNLSISFKLKELLQCCGFSVIMTRQDDHLIGAGDASTIRGRKQQDLSARLAMTESVENCVLLSIHQNHFQEAKYSGAQVFYTDNHSGNKMLAQSIQDRIQSLLQQENQRQIKTIGSDIFLLDRCQQPAVMIECGFMSNPKELSLLKNEAYQSKMAFCIAMGLFDCYL